MSGVPGLINRSMMVQLVSKMAQLTLLISLCAVCSITCLPPPPRNHHLQKRQTTLISGETVQAGVDDCMSRCTNICDEQSQEQLMARYVGWLLRPGYNGQHSRIIHNDDLQTADLTTTHTLKESRNATCHDPHALSTHHSIDLNLCPEHHWMSVDGQRFPSVMPWVTCMEESECSHCRALSEPGKHFVCMRNYIQHKVLRRDCCGCWAETFETLPNRCYCAYPKPTDMLSVGRRAGQQRFSHLYDEIADLRKYYGRAKKRMEKR